MKLHGLRVSEIMTREVLSIEASASLRAAARAMSEHHVHCLIVTPDAPSRCAGVITTKDIVQVLCEADVSALDDLTVQDAMTGPAFGLQHDHTVLDGLRLMRRCGVRSAPVLEGTRVVGLLSYTDVVRAASDR